jgi:phospholipid/cholesterol/gamma-HCH transport system substrate-binding protein
MRSTSIKLTVFTVFTIIVTFWLGSVIGNISPLKETYQVEAVFTDATGILVGDLVKIAGVDVGKVTGFKVEEGEAVVAMEIDGGVELPRDVIVEAKFRNLLGQRVINLIRPDSFSPENLEDGDRVPVTQTRPALDIGIVFNNLRPLINSTDPEDINTVAQAVLDIFEGNEKDFAGLLGNVGTITKTLADGDQRLARLIEDLDGLTILLNDESTSVKTGFNRFTELIESLADVTPTIERVVTQLNQASTRFGGILAKNRDNIDQELDDLAALLGIVNDNLGSVDAVAKNLKEVLLASARSQGYGKWWNLYVVNLCLEAVPDPPQALECSR